MAGLVPAISLSLRRAFVQDGIATDSLRLSHRSPAAGGRVRGYGLPRVPSPLTPTLSPAGRGSYATDSLHLSHRERSPAAGGRVRGYGLPRVPSPLTPTLSPAGRGSYYNEHARRPGHAYHRRMCSSTAAVGQQSTFSLFFF